MADISNTDRGSSKGHSKPRSKKHSLRVDMTPMVDLAFLLISFFMLTIVLTDEKALKVTMPNNTGEPDDVGECQVMHVLIDSADRVFTYEGLDVRAMQPTSFDADHGVRQVLMSKSKLVSSTCPKDKHGKPRKMVCLISLLPGAHYSSMINILDEMEITGTDVYSMQEPLAAEVEEVAAKGLLADNSGK
ncbi:MAG TPA: biopolymer transporter ExbD [Chitinophagales bacterium]|nr:biopolymer transporter ExbD [Chitinophagales bacterium]